MTEFDPVEACRRYFDGWRRHDADAVLGCFAEGGDYEDPTTGGPMSGEALRSYMQRLWQAFPDLSFEPGELHQLSMGEVHCSWIMRGTQIGPFNGLPPSGLQVRLPGIDVFEVGASGIQHVTGYFDSVAIPRQLGLSVVVQPSSIGPISFGVSTAVRRDRPTLPAVFAVTELVASSDEAVGPLREQSRAIVIDQIRNPALLSFTGAVVGRRMCTFTGWGSHEAMSEAMRTGTHVRSMQDMFSKNLVEAAYTAVYAPVRQFPQFRRCECGTMARLDSLQGRCQKCETSLEVLP